MPSEPVVPEASGWRSDWLRATGLPPEVGGGMATRAGGVSVGPWAGLNLRPSRPDDSGQDDPAAVKVNQLRFAQALEGSRPYYLDQVHGTDVVRLGSGQVLEGLAVADASYTTEPGLACVVQVADCLPVLLAAPQGRGVAAAHAGWRGLAAGVLENTVAALCATASCEPSQVCAWLGACIGPQRFEVGAEVRDAFGEAGLAHFRPGLSAGKWLADLPGLARSRLSRLGVTHVSGGTWCTASDPSRFYSFRRDRSTGRHAAAIWIRR